MSAGFTVDYDALATMAVELKALQDEFAGLAADGDGQATGHAPVAEALGVFATNWLGERRKIIDALEEIARYSRDAAEAYRETDTGLGGDLAPT